MAKKKEPTSYTYGPVPSRRLGLSLGVDIVPPKICTLDCVYCQLGRTITSSTTRADFVDINAVLAEIESKLRAGLKTDYITLGGSGEPTLNSRLGDLIDGIRRLTDIPVAILTNGTLLYRADVRAECAKADVVAPSLDAGDAVVFQAVNRPNPDITLDKLVSGMEQFRDEFRGRIWLEVFLVAGVNTDDSQIEKIRSLIRRIRPDKVHLNTAVRPPAEPNVRAMSREALGEIARRIGGICEVIGEAPAASEDRRETRAEADVISVLKRRPCTIEDICAGLGMNRHEAAKHIGHLQSAGKVHSEPRGSVLYFHIRPDVP
ncbi:MAG: radical SAM protein [Phycisphaerae bacterium]|nr:radical SAM protein [Phycisphaerae bacterium]